MFIPDLDRWPQPVFPSNEIPSKFFFAPILAVFGGNILLGILVQIFFKKDNSWIDAWWSISFLIPNILVLILRGTAPEEEMPFRYISARMWLITACVALWSLRLSIYIFIRHKREDYRYKEMREEWT